MSGFATSNTPRWSQRGIPPNDDIPPGAQKSPAVCRKDWQTKKFVPAKGRYIKLRALRNTDGNNDVGNAEVDVITN
jgi:hypothetical protein